MDCGPLHPYSALQQSCRPREQPLQRACLLMAGIVGSASARSSNAVCAQLPMSQACVSLHASPSARAIKESNCPAYAHFLPALHAVACRSFFPHTHTRLSLGIRQGRCNQPRGDAPSSSARSHPSLHCGAGPQHRAQKGSEQETAWAVCKVFTSALACISLPIMAWCQHNGNSAPAAVLRLPGQGIRARTSCRYSQPLIINDRGTQPGAQHQPVVHA